MSIIRNTTAVMAHSRALPVTLAIVITALIAIPARAQGPSGSQWVAPERASHRANPTPVTAEAVKRGYDLFKRDCEQCHGKAGHGDGPQSGSLQPRPADLATERVQQQSEGAIFWKITEGRGMMPRAALNETDKWSVIAYLRTLAAQR